MLIRLGFVCIRGTGADDRDIELAGILALPSANVRQERIARAAGWIGEQQHRRQAVRPDRVERQYLAMQTLQFEGWSWCAHRQARRGCGRTRDRSGSEPKRAIFLSGFERIESKENSAILTQEMDQDVSDGGDRHNETNEEKGCDDFPGAQIAHPSQQARACITVRKRPTIRAEKNNE